MAADAEAIRDLHAPSESFGLVCDGCDSEGWESEPPAWPCRTAALVYSEAEIAEVVATYDAERQKAVASGGAFFDDAARSLAQTLTRRSPLMELVARGGADEVVTVAHYAPSARGAAS